MTNLADFSVMSNTEIFEKLFYDKLKEHPFDEKLFVEVIKELFNKTCFINEGLRLNFNPNKDIKLRFYSGQLSFTYGENSLLKTVFTLNRNRKKWEIRSTLKNIDFNSINVRQIRGFINIFREIKLDDDISWDCRAERVNNLLI